METALGREGRDVMSDKRTPGAKPKTGEIWRHYKGGEYTIICCAEMEATREIMVVYQSADGNRWIRPIARWHDIVANGRYRFERVS